MGASRRVYLRLQGGDGIRLVVLDAHDRTCSASGAHHRAKPFEDEPGLLAEQTVVAGQEGLALGRVQDDGLDPFPLGRTYT